MTTVDTLTLIFRFVSAEGETAEFEDSFDPADSSLLTTIENRRDELLDELGDGEWEDDGWSIESYDTVWADPEDFDDLNDYGRYAENVEQFGEAFHLRYDDIGGIDAGDFEDSYHGCWDSFEEYAENYVDDCMDLDEFAARYFDYERFARDLAYDYSTYNGNDGTHVFHNY